MSEYRVASRYAKSLIELSKEKGILEQVKEDIVLFKTTCEESRDLRLMLNSPLIAHLRKATILKQIFNGKISEVTATFFDVVCKKARESVLIATANEFINQYNAVKGIQKAKITTAIALTDEMRNTLKSVIKEAINKEVELEEVVDESLIGGFVVNVGDRQVDDSIKGRLEDLKASLLS